MAPFELARLVAANIAARHDLTPSETRVLAGLVAGLTPEEIARERACAAATVRVHVRAVHSKLRIRRSTALIRLALEEISVLYAHTPLRVDDEDVQCKVSVASVQSRA